MIITTQTRYAVMSLVYILECGASNVVPLRKIADSQKLDLRYLEQIFNRLKKAGIVASVKGPGGGYRFAQSPSKITLRSVFETFQDGLKLTACTNPKASSCRNSSVACNSHALWSYLEQKFSSVLDDITILSIYNDKYNYNDC